MKKLLSLVLALALVLTFAVSAFADEVVGSITNANDEKLEEDVRVYVSANEEAVYRVSLEWDDLDFEYKLGNWDTNAYKYREGAWVPFTAGGQVAITDGLSSDVVVTNHSNRDITVSAALSVDDPWTAADASLVNNAATVIPYVVEAGEGTTTPSAHTFQVQVTGHPTSTTSTIVIGHVIVTLEGSDNQGGALYTDAANAVAKAADWQLRTDDK